MTKHYLRIEGVNLNNFVYETQDLSTIRGSGLLLLRAVDDLFRTSQQSQSAIHAHLNKVSSGASTGLFWFEAPDLVAAQDVCQDAIDFLKGHPCYKYATFVVSVTQATDQFPRDRETLLAMNRWQQMTSPQVAIPAWNNIVPTPNSAAACQLDFVRTAKFKRPIKGELKFISESVRQRRNQGIADKSDTETNLVKQELMGIGQAELVKHKFAWHFETLTRAKDKGNLHHKMAVIYIDGNAFGRLQKDLGEAELETFDKTKSNFQRKWLSHLVADMNEAADWRIKTADVESDDEVSQVVLGLEKTEEFYRMEVLLWGGDEICIAVPAWKGWEVVANFFSETCDLKWNDGTPLTHAAGLVFCHHNAPIRRIKDLACDLAEIAKRASRKRNLCVYEILESFDHIGHDNLEAYRASRSPQPDHSDELPDPSLLILAGGVMKDIGTILKTIKPLLPRRKLAAIVRGLLSPSTGTPEFVAERNATKKMMSEVLDELNPQRALVKKLIALLGGDRAWWIQINALWDYVAKDMEE